MIAGTSLCWWSAGRPWVSATDDATAVLRGTTTISGRQLCVVLSLMPLLALTVLVTLAVGGVVWVRVAATLTALAAASGIGQAVAVLRGRATLPGFDRTSQAAGALKTALHPTPVLAALAAFVAILIACVIANAAARTWRRLSARYTRPAAASATRSATAVQEGDVEVDTASMWADLDKGRDPTLPQ